jgi:hypothetical protein
MRNKNILVGKSEADRPFGDLGVGRKMLLKGNLKVWT